MKKFLFLAAMLLAALSATAQNTRIAILETVVREGERAPRVSRDTTRLTSPPSLGLGISQVPVSSPTTRSGSWARRRELLIF